MCVWGGGGGGAHGWGQGGGQGILCDSKLDSLWPRQSEARADPHSMCVLVEPSHHNSNYCGNFCCPSCLLLPLLQCCFTSTETVRILGTGSPRGPSLLSHSPGALVVQFKFNVALLPQRPYRLLETGSPGPGRPPRFSHSP